MNMSNLTVLKILSPVSLLLFPFLNYINVNYLDPSFVGNIFYEFTLIFILSIVLLIALILLLTWLLNKKIPKERFIFAAVCAFILLFYLPLIIGPPKSLFSPKVFITILNLTSIVIAYLIYLICKNKNMFNIYKIFSIAISIVALFGIIFQIITSQTPNSTTPNIPIISEEVNPVIKKNIYYVILDGHSSFKNLAKYGFENNQFLDEMDRLGYYHAKNAKSSYNVTHLTLSAILEANYFLNDQSPKYINRASFFPRMLSANSVNKEPPYLIDFIKSYDYDFYWSGNNWGPCDDKWSKCVVNRTPDIIPYTIKQFFFENSFYSLHSKLLRRINSYYGYELPVDLDDSIGQTLNLLNKDGISQKPSFYLIHHMYPHNNLPSKCTVDSGEPLSISNIAIKTALEKLSDYELIIKALDSGNRDKIKFSPNQANDNDIPTYKKDLANRKELIEALYFDSIEDSDLIKKAVNYLLPDVNTVKGLLPHLKSTECAQRSIIQLAGFLEKNDPEAIVIFQADHGAGFSTTWDAPLSTWTENVIDERLSIINFLRVPKICKPFLSDSLGNVNSVRIALACGINQNPTLLNNTQYLGVYEGHQDYGTLRRVD